MLYINTPFTKAFSHMPSYAKLLKEMLSNKQKKEDTDIVVLTQEYNVVIQKKLPLKLKDLGRFLVPCVIGTMHFEKALCDLGESSILMPLTFYEKLGLGGTKPTRMSL